MAVLVVSVATHPRIYIPGFDQVISELLVKRAAVSHESARKGHVADEPPLGVGEFAAILRPASALAAQANNQGGGLGEIKTRVGKFGGHVTSRPARDFCYADAGYIYRLSILFIYIFVCGISLAIKCVVSAEISIRNYVRSLSCAYMYARNVSDYVYARKRDCYIYLCTRRRYYSII